MRDDAIGLSEFTEPMRVLITECASEGSGQGAEWFVCSAKPLEHGLEIAERDVDQFEAGEPEADGACAGDPRVDDLADGLDVDLAADGVLGCAVGLVVLVAIPITLGVAFMVAVLVAALVSTRAGVARIAALARAVDAEQDPGAEAELALAEGQRSRQRDVLVIEVEHRLPDLDPPP